MMWNWGRLELSNKEFLFPTNSYSFCWSSLCFLCEVRPILYKIMVINVFSILFHRKQFAFFFSFSLVGLSAQFSSKRSGPASGFILLTPKGDNSIQCSSDWILIQLNGSELQNQNLLVKRLLKRQNMIYTTLLSCCCYSLCMLWKYSVYTIECLQRIRGIHRIRFKCLPAHNSNESF